MWLPPCMSSQVHTCARRPPRALPARADLRTGSVARGGGGAARDVPRPHSALLRPTGARRGIQVPVGFSTGARWRSKFHRGGDPLARVFGGRQVESGDFSMCVRRRVESGKLCSPWWVATGPRTRNTGAVQASFGTAPSGSGSLLLVLCITDIYCWLL